MTDSLDWIANVRPPWGVDGPSDACPLCGRSDAILPIVYGRMPPDEMLGDAAGTFLGGGCVMFPDSPEYGCRRCCEEELRAKGLWEIDPD